jgi:DNA uptake protein ComE-like DNA-binding protein
MKSVRKWIRDLFGFSGNEINGFLILIPLVLVVVISEPVYHRWVAAQPSDEVKDRAVLDSLIAGWELQKVGSAPVGENFVPFDFDPNTAPVADLRKLGLSENSATHIAAYRRKGGVFRVKSDLLRIRGLDSSLYKRLYSHITLPTRRSSRPRDTGGKASSWLKKEVRQKFDINTADTLQLKSVYGIGSRLAARIVKFRDGLGGFIRTDQLFEVYGLDSMTVKRLRDVCFIHADFVPEQININTADEKTLSAHPYVRYKLARLLVSYRFQHGDFTTATDIKNLSVITPEELERLLPYLKTKD